METAITPEYLGAKAATPFEINQLSCGLALDSADIPLLQYLNFFTEKVKIATASFLHVMPDFYVYRADRLLSAKYNIKDTVSAKMEDLLEEHLQLHRLGSLQFQIDEGDPLEELLKTVKKNKSDLVLIGKDATTDQHGIRAKRLARKVDSNALVVPSRARKELSRIMVPIDFSSSSAQALKTALSIRKAFGKQVDILCVHVFEMPYFAAYNIGKTEKQFNRMVKADRQEAFEAFLAEHVAKEETNISAELIEKTSPQLFHYLMKFANENEIDFVVMGAKGHSAIDLLLMGSVTESFLTANEKYPVMIVR